SIFSLLASMFTVAGSAALSDPIGQAKYTDNAHTMLNTAFIAALPFIPSSTVSHRTTPPAKHLAAPSALDDLPFWQGPLAASAGQSDALTPLATPTNTLFTRKILPPAWHIPLPPPHLAPRRGQARPAP